LPGGLNIALLEINFTVTTAIRLQVVRMDFPEEQEEVKFYV